MSSSSLFTYVPQEAFKHSLAICLRYQECACMHFPEEIRFTSISQFGIGILSCFMVAEGIIIETKTDESEPWRVEIEDIGDYFYITAGRRTESGTTVIVKLKPSESDIDLEHAIRHYTRHLEFPIRLTVLGKKERTIQRADIKPILREHASAQLYKCDFHVTKFKKPNIEGTYAITCKRASTGKLTLLDESDKHRAFGSPLLTGTLVSNEGIFIGEAPYLTPNLRGIMIDVNVKGLDPDLNLARTKILPGEKFEHLSSLLCDLLIDGIEKWFEEIGNEEGLARVFDLSRRLFRFYIRDSDDDVGHRSFLKLFNRLHIFPVFSIDGLRYLALPELMKMKEQIVIIPRHYFLLRSRDETRLKYFADIFFNSTWSKPNVLYIFDPPHFTFELPNAKKPGFRTSNMVRMIKRKIIRDTRGYFPKTWKVVKFENYKTHRLVDEFGYYTHVYVNVENRFIQLLFSKGEQVISSKLRADAVKSFFKGFRGKVRKDFDKVRKEQKNILVWFKEAGLITNINELLLTAQDFPPNWTT